MSSPERIETYHIPEGYSIRPTTMDDAEAFVQLWAAISTHMGIPEQLDADEERAEWNEPNFNLSDSSIVVEDQDGQVIASATLWDNSEVPVRPQLSFNVHPAHENKGLEQFLIQWLENKSMRVLERCPSDAKITFNVGTLSTYEPRKKILEAAGYIHQRNFHRMKITLSEAPAQAKIAEGFSIRPMNYPDEFKAGVMVRTAAFRDHYGFVEESPEVELQYWNHYVSTDKLFDSSLYFLAIEDKTGEIAGVCWGRMEEHGDTQNAYVSQVGVLPKYRKKGLALSLLLHSFNEFWKRGRKNITLYVDASSLTGATRLYEKAGMSPDRTWASYGKIIRDGRNLATMSLKQEEES